MFELLCIIQLSCKRTFHNYRASAIDIPWYKLNSIYLDTYWIYLHIQYTWTHVFNIPWYILNASQYCSPANNVSFTWNIRRKYSPIHIDTYWMRPGMGVWHDSMLRVPWRIHMEYLLERLIVSSSILAINAPVSRNEPPLRMPRFFFGPVSAIRLATHMI